MRDSLTAAFAAYDATVSESARPGPFDAFLRTWLRKQLGDDAKIGPVIAQINKYLYNTSPRPTTEAEAVKHLPRIVEILKRAGQWPDMVITREPTLDVHSKRWTNLTLSTRADLPTDGRVMKHVVPGGVPEARPGKKGYTTMNDRKVAGTNIPVVHTMLPDRRRYLQKNSYQAAIQEAVYRPGPWDEFLETWLREQLGDVPLGSIMNHINDELKAISPPPHNEGDVVKYLPRIMEKLNLGGPVREAFGEEDETDPYDSWMRKIRPILKAQLQKYPRTKGQYLSKFEQVVLDRLWKVFKNRVGWSQSELSHAVKIVLDEYAAQNYRTDKDLDPFRPTNDKGEPVDRTVSQKLADKPYVGDKVRGTRKTWFPWEEKKEPSDQVRPFTRHQDYTRRSVLKNSFREAMDAIQGESRRYTEGEDCPFCETPMEFDNDEGTCNNCGKKAGRAGSGRYWTKEEVKQEAGAVMVSTPYEDSADQCGHCGEMFSVDPSTGYCSRCGCHCGEGRRMDMAQRLDAGYLSEAIANYHSTVRFLESALTPNEELAEAIITDHLQQEAVETLVEAYCFLELASQESLTSLQESDEGEGRYSEGRLDALKNRIKSRLAGVKSDRLANAAQKVADKAGSVEKRAAVLSVAGKLLGAAATFSGVGGKVAMAGKMLSHVGGAAGKVFGAAGLVKTLAKSVANRFRAPKEAAYLVRLTGHAGGDEIDLTLGTASSQEEAEKAGQEVRKLMAQNALSVAKAKGLPEDQIAAFQQAVFNLAIVVERNPRGKHTPIPSFIDAVRKPEEPEEPETPGTAPEPAEHGQGQQPSTPRGKSAKPGPSKKGSEKVNSSSRSSRSGRSRLKESLNRYAESTDLLRESVIRESVEVISEGIVGKMASNLVAAGAKGLKIPKAVMDTSVRGVVGAVNKARAAGSAVIDTVQLAAGLVTILSRMAPGVSYQVLKSIATGTAEDLSRQLKNRLDEVDEMERNRSYEKWDKRGGK